MDDSEPRAWFYDDDTQHVHAEIDGREVSFSIDEARELGVELFLTAMDAASATRERLADELAATLEG